MVQETQQAGPLWFDFHDERFPTTAPDDNPDAITTPIRVGLLHIPSSDPAPYSGHPSWMLVQADVEIPFARLSSLIRADPTPAPSKEGYPRFYMKTYSENEGILENLIKLNILRDTGSSIPQGYVKFPLVEVILPEEQWQRCCQVCGHFEQEGAPRFGRCTKCLKIAYCSKECQKKGWPDHKQSCKPR